MWRSASQRAPASHYDARSSPTTLGYHHSPSSSTAATCPEPPIRSPIRLRHNSPHRLKTTGGYQQPPANYIETGQMIMPDSQSLTRLPCPIHDDDSGPAPSREQRYPVVAVFGAASRP